MRPITFENFLSGAPVREYCVQEQPPEEQLRRAADFLKSADYVLIGAGAGLSTAAGAEYGGEWFKEHFADFREKYGEDNPYMQDMYSAGFYPYPTEEAFWGNWSREALLAGIDADFTPLHRVLLDMLKDKNLFVLSTNADMQFTKAGLPEGKIFCTQGDYAHIQCARGCHQKIYDAEQLFRQMAAQCRGCLVPTVLVPKCPVCGGRMAMNLRADGYFVQDGAWYTAERRFGAFLTEALQSGRPVCLLELGVGFNTPGIIRFPFERLVRDYKNVTLIRLNRSKAMVPRELTEKCVGINGDLKAHIEALAELT